MGCIEELKPEVLMARVSFREARTFIEKSCPEVYYFQPGFKIFGEYIIGVPPIAVGLDGDQVVFPFTKPCHGTFVLRHADTDEAARVRTLGKKETLKTLKKR